MSETLPLGTGLPEDGPFMNDRQKEYFRKKLLNWKADILRESRETLEALRARTPIWPMRRIGPRRRRTAPSSCGRAIVSAS